MTIRESILGCLLGTAVGDALGLPYEGLDPRKAARVLGKPDRHRLFFGRGMISDDTEHTCMVAQSLLESGNDLDLFLDRFSKRLRWWIVCLPAGVGLATARSCIRLWLGYRPDKSGVRSAGNGAAMRAALLGVAIEDFDTMLSFVRGSTRITHLDPKAEFGAIAVAIAAREFAAPVRCSPERWLYSVEKAVGDDALEFTMLLKRVVLSVQRGESTKSFAASLGLDRGVSGYVYDTVPICAHAWLSHPDDYREAITSVIQCGGDADTTAAIVGGVVGARVGLKGIPQDWIDGLRDWPRSTHWISALADRLSESRGLSIRSGVPTLNPLAILLRNLIFLLVVLVHGFRRMIP